MYDVLELFKEAIARFS